jgi:hypothetical protein
MRRRAVSDEQILAAITELADDGFCRREDLRLRFRAIPSRDLRKSIGRAGRRGLILERRAPDGRTYLVVSSEGWNLLREGSDSRPARTSTRERRGPADRGSSFEP